MDLPQDIEVARFRLPIHASGLADLAGIMERIYRSKLKMREEPKGWLQFLKPAPSEEAGQ